MCILLDTNTSTFAELWIDDKKIAELTRFQAKIEKQTEDVKLCGYMFQYRKVVGYKGSGSVKMKKMSTIFQKSKC